MGRTLFSMVPAVRIEPEPTVDLCEKWGVRNRFDPDSDDFFQDAEYEAFVDPIQYRREQEELAAVAQTDVATESSDSSESNSERGSPMAVGSDDPAILIATYADHPWTSSTAGSGWPSPTVDHSTGTAGITYNPRRMQSVFGARPHELDDADHLGNPVFIPPASFREPSPDIELEVNRNPPSSSPTVRRTVNITPIAIPADSDPPTRSLSLHDRPITPSTPPPLVRYQTSPVLLTPSPAPSATPRFYSWQHRPIATLPPISPTLSRGKRDGAFTNPHARISLMPIDDTRMRIRHPDIVI